MTKSGSETRLDVVSLGESMLRLSVPLGTRLDNMSSLDVEVGGAESNVCVALPMNRSVFPSTREIAYSFHS